MYRILVVFWIVLSLLSFGSVYAEDVRLDEIVVTATRTEEDIEKISANITVITQEDIKNSAAITVEDLLRNEEGLLVRDLYGTGTKSIADMRGFGRGLNTVVLIDGRKINEIDLSGVDWNLIPLENIEKIEIVRGSGSVLYGDNAMSGVINIITKKGKAIKPQAEVETRLESFGGSAEHFNLKGGTDKLNYFLFGRYLETNGYRSNSEFKGNDLSAAVSVNMTDMLSVDLSGKYHNDQQGYPGGLTEDQLEVDRRQTLSPDDSADYDQYFYGINLNYSTGDWGELTVGYNFNNRKFDTDIWGGNVKRDTDTDEIKLKLILTSSLFNYKNLLVTGLDRYGSQVDNTSAYPFFGTTTSNITKRETGYYLQNEVFFNDKWSMSLGYRYTDAKFEDVVTGASAGSGDQRFREIALRAGFTYNYAKKSKGFINYSRGFRLPTTDELFAYDGTIVELKPEEADTYEGGIVHSFSEKSEVRLTLYTMDINDEIYFNPSTFANENLDMTRHEGAELGFSAGLTELISLFGNWTYTSAVFKSGPSDGKMIPLIPEHSTNTGVNLKLYKYYAITVIGNWVGERFLENDIGNVSDKLPAYLTVNTKLSYQYKTVSAYIGVNNIFNEEYIEYGALGSTGNKSLYPAPLRQYYGGIKVAF